MASDGVYGYRPWTANTPEGDPYYAQSPNEQMLTQQALAPVMGMNEEQIRQIRPVIPINPFPDRFGYRTEAIGINDIGILDRIYERVDFTGRSSGYSGSFTPAYNSF